MKTKLILGMMTAAIMGFSMTAQADVRPGAVAHERTVKDQIEAYKKVVERYLYGKGSGGAVGEQANDAHLSKTLSDLGVGAAEKGNLTSILKSSKASDAAQASRWNKLMLLLTNRAFFRDTSSLQGEQKVDAESRYKAADALIKLLANSDKIGARTKSDLLSETEMKEVRENFGKVEELIERILEMDPKSRDSYTKLLEAIVEKLKDNRNSFEDAVIKALMEMKGLTKEQALELLRKLKLCE